MTAVKKNTAQVKKQRNKKLKVVKVKDIRLARRLPKLGVKSASPNAKKISVKRNTMQDRIDLKWTLSDKKTVLIYQSNITVAASGVIDFPGETNSGITKVAVKFLNGIAEVDRFIVVPNHSIAFTVQGFDTIKLTGYGDSSQDSAAGKLSLKIRLSI